MACELFTSERCEGCPFQSGTVGTRGPVEADIVVVGEAPGQQELRDGQPFVGPSGKLANKVLREAGIDPETVLFTNAYRCLPPKGEMDDWEVCRERLIGEITAYPRKVIIAFGGVALRSLANDDMLTIGQNIGQWFFVEGIPTIATYHPAYVLRQPNEYSKLSNVVISTATYLRTGKLAPDEVFAWVPRTDEEFESALRVLHSWDEIACDIETSKSGLLCIGFSAYDNFSIVISGKMFIEHLEQMVELLEDRSKDLIWHNGKFDTRWLYQKFGIDGRVNHDSMLQHYTLDESTGGQGEQDAKTFGGHGLKILSQVYLGAPDYKASVRQYIGSKNGDWALIPDEVLWQYNAQDTSYTYQLFCIFRELLRKPENEGPNRLYHTMLIPMSNFLRKVETRGIAINVTKLYEYGLVIDRRIADIGQEIADIVDQYWDSAEYVRMTGAKSEPEEFNFGSWRQVHWLIYDRLRLRPKPEYRRGFKRNTSEECIRQLQDHPLTMALLSHREMVKLKGTYIDGILNRLDPDGRIRSNYWIHGTWTGRISSRDPNLQNIPRANSTIVNIKDAFIARATFDSKWNVVDRVLIEFDYSQCIARDSWVGDVRIQDHDQAVFRGISDTIKVRTKRGYSVECTPDHRILTNEGWIEARNLTNKHWVALQGECDTKDTGDPLFWWLVGLWVGDGSYGSSRGSLTFAQKQADYLNEIEYLIEDGLGERPRTYGTVNSYHVTDQREFADMLRDMFDKKDLRIPFDRIDNLGSFLSGLFDADGYADQFGVGFSTRFKRLAEDVQNALLRYGIMSTLTQNLGGFNFVPEGSISYRVYISDSVSLINFDEFIGFRLSYKGAMLDSSIADKGRDQENYVPIPHTSVRVLGVDYKKYVFNYIHGRPYTRRKLYEVNNDRLYQWTRFHWDTFANLDSGSVGVEVYDLMDQPEQMFVANGVIVHNCELRVLALFSQDEYLIEVYKQGRDLHSETAVLLFGDDFTDEERTIAKTLNFGIVYGLTTSGIVSKYGTKARIPFNKDGAQRFINLIYDRSPKMTRFIKWLRAHPKADKVIETPFGRRRHWRIVDQTNLHNLQNEASNYPIQSVASDLLLLSAMSVDDWLEERDAHIVNAVHDSMVVDCPDDPVLINEIVKHVIEVMEQMPIRTLGDIVPFKADCKIGYTWGSVVSYSKWSKGVYSAG